MIHFWDLFKKKQVNNSEENTQQNVSEVISPDQIASENIFEKLGDKSIHTLIIADTHSHLNEEELPKTDMPYDLLICLGDIGWSDWQRLFSYPQFKNIPYKIGIVGNHDSNDFSEINQWLQESNVTPIINLHNVSYTLPDYNLIFAGIKASVKYKNDSNLLTQKRAYDISEQMPKADILITHSNPKLEYDIEDDIYPNAHAGLYGITNYMIKNHCTYNIHGHVHEKYIKRHKLNSDVFYELSFYRVSSVNITKNGIIYLEENR